MEIRHRVRDYFYGHIVFNGFVQEKILRTCKELGKSRKFMKTVLFLKRNIQGLAEISKQNEKGN